MTVQYLGRKNVEETLAEVLDTESVTEKGGRVFHHPLHSGAHDPQAEGEDPDWLENLVADKLERLENLRKEKNWSEFIFLHERAFRPGVCAEVVAYRLVDPTVEPELIRAVWEDAQAVWSSAFAWIQIFGRMKPEHFNRTLDEEEQALRAALAERFTIYRGYDAAFGKAAQVSHSWTLDADTARKFAESNPRAQPEVVAATIEKSVAVGPLDHRGEREILVLDPWTYKARGQLEVQP